MSVFSPSDAQSVAPASEQPLFDLVGAGQLVPVVGGGCVPYVNLDMAASTPALRSVSAAVSEVLEWYSSVHRGAGFVSQVATEVLESARAVVGRFVGAPKGSSVIFTRNTTDALNLLSSSLPAGTSVITYASAHHANLLPWRGHDGLVIEVSRDLGRLLESTAQALRALAGRPAVLAVTGASNVTGEVWPLVELVELAHRHGARVAVDAAQLVAHRAIQLAELGADYLAFSGHKMYAPFGAGVLVGPADWLDDATPYLAGGGAVRHVSLGRTEWLTGPARHEAGTPNLVGIAALAAACEALGALGMDVVADHEAALLDRMLDGLGRLGSAVVYSMWPGEAERIGVASFNVDSMAHSHLAAVLSAEYGIGLRDGKFCAHPLVEDLTGPNPPGGGAVRASLGVGTTAADVDRLLDALEAVCARGAAWSYRMVDGRFAPDPDPRPRPRFTHLSFAGSR